MSAATIFISYTSRDDTSKRVSKVLYDHLRANCTGLKPWRDKDRLLKGEQWSDTLAERLVSSNAGVLLLTEQALESSWVLKEATYMALRAQTDPEYVLIPVLLDGLNRQKVRTSNFESLDLERLELLQASSDEELNSRISESLRVVGHMWKDRTSETALIDKIAFDLDQLNHDMLLRLATYWDLGLRDWFPTGQFRQPLAKIVAKHLTTCRPDTAVGGLRQVIEFIDKEKAQRILHFLLAFQVDGNGAGTLASIASKNPPSESAAINAKSLRVGQYYIWRASGGLRAWEYESLDGIFDPEGGGDDIIEEIRESVLFLQSEPTKDMVGGSDSDPANPCVIILPGPITETFLQRLKIEFNDFLFFILDENLQPDSRLCKSQYVQFLNPPLTAEKEGDIIAQADKAKKYLLRGYRQLDP